VLISENEAVITANPVAQFEPAFEVIRRVCASREVSWLKPTRWRGQRWPEIESISHLEPQEDKEGKPEEPLREVAPEKLPLIERYAKEHLPERIAASVSRRVPVDFWFKRTNHEGHDLIECQEFTSEANFWLVLAVDQYKELPGVDFKALVRQRIEGSLFDLFRAEHGHEFSKPRCTSCSGSGWDDAGKCKCVDCRGRGYTYKRNSDRIDDYRPDPDDPDPEYIYPLPEKTRHIEQTMVAVDARNELLAVIRTAVNSAVGCLPARQQVAVLGIHANDQTQQDVALGTGVSQATVSRNLKAGTQLLITLLIPAHIAEYARARFREIPTSEEMRRDLYIGGDKRRGFRPRDWWGEIRAKHTPYTWYGKSGGANTRAAVRDSIGHHPLRSHPPCDLPCNYAEPSHGPRTRRYARPYPWLLEATCVPVNPIPPPMDPDGAIRKARLSNPFWDSWRAAIVLVNFADAECGVRNHYRSDGQWILPNFLKVAAA
jgi:RNA polymerase sigma factor (sigma-70 family)